MPLKIRREWSRLQWWRRLHSDSLHALPTAILSITDQCNSRCNCCDYWRAGQSELPMGVARQLVEKLAAFGSRYVLLTGGEPLQHPHWASIAAMFKARGIKIALATSGILIVKHADAILSCVDELYVSLDAATAETYKAVRGVDGLSMVGRGVESIAGSLPVTVRTTVQRANYREIPAMIRLTRSWGAAQHSFLAVDVHNQAAFGRSAAFDRSMALRTEDLKPFAAVLDDTEREFEVEFARHYIVESKAKLRHLYGYFAALLGLQGFPPVRCNAPRFSVFIQPDGFLKPCFFLPPYARSDDLSMADALNTPAARDLRQQQRLGRRPECVHCVCPAFKCGRDLVEDP
jgi:Fe-coproporphyrin III synthase